VAYQSSAVVNMSAAPVEETLVGTFAATEMVFLILNDHRPRQTIGTRTGTGTGNIHLDKIKDDLRSQDPGLSRARVGMDSIVV
jgi:hypothetical protein